MTSETEKDPIVVRHTYDVAPEAVWRAITDPKEMPKWFFEPIATFEPRVGFETIFVVEVEDERYVHRWTVTEVVPERSLAYRWRYDGVEGDSHVRWELEGSGSSTSLILTHTGHESFPRDNPIFSREAGVGGWTYFVQRSLAAYLQGLPRPDD